MQNHAHSGAEDSDLVDSGRGRGLEEPWNDEIYSSVDTAASPVLGQDNDLLPCPLCPPQTQVPRPAQDTTEPQEWGALRGLPVARH